jgi:hypothetical protein
VTDEPLIPVFIPQLAQVLGRAEQKKGSRLTQVEVETLRDKSTCIMMREKEAAAMDESRGYRDVNPDNCWADWHRVRPQIVGGYVPRIVMCIPGSHELSASEPLLKGMDLEYEFRPHEQAISTSFAWYARVGRLTHQEYAAICNHSTTLYVLSRSYVSHEAREIARSFLNFGARLLDMGGLGIKIDSSGVVHARDRWKKFDQVANGPTEAQWLALFQAFVVNPIGSDREMYTCGMHLLGVPDLILSTNDLQLPTAQTSPDQAASDLFAAFGLYILSECPIGKFASGNTFSLAEGAPRYRVTWEPYRGDPEDSFFFNPYGRWRFTRL